MIKETPYWWATAPELPSYADKPLPQRADVVVIGSGYTGLSAARSLAQRGASVVVLEKETIGWGASSRNGGQVLTGLAVGPAALIKQVGADRAKALYATSLKGMDFIEALIRTEQIDCDFERVGHIEAACKPAHFKHFQHAQEVLAREFNHPIRVLGRSQQREELGTDYYHGVLIDERSLGVHPAKYVRGLALAAERAGAQLHEKTPALAIERGATHWRVFTPRGPIGAQEILVATNGYTDAVAPALRRRIIPVGSYIIATEPLPLEVTAKILPQRRMAYDSKNFLAYFRLSSDNRLLFGGRAEYKVSSPETTRRSVAILRRSMIEIFPELANVAIEYSWSGNVCFTPDFLPRIGQMNGLHYALAYAGHGVSLATYLGAQAADLISGTGGQTPFAELPFNSIPLYTGTPWFMPLGALWYKLLDIVQ
ncbi:MAG: FAD-binding oxidoreductase [Thermoflexales bacterium]|nr:FAD-binding oxidoreductase [Thermoflexales bacterium]